MDKNNLENTILQVEGMSCQHCIKNVSETITSLYPNANVNVDLDKGEVSIDQVDLDLEKISNAIHSAGYKVL